MSFGGATSNVLPIYAESGPEILLSLAPKVTALGPLSVVNLRMGYIAIFPSFGYPLHSLVPMRKLLILGMKCLQERSNELRQTALC